MNVYQAKTGRFLLYLDILGFKELVRNRKPEEAYDAIDQMLRECFDREQGIPEFSTLYFSDTIIFYQQPVGYGSWAFSDVYSLSGMIWSALAARHIPTRGAISFGEFHTELDSSGKHTVFFGNALVEAAEMESAEASRNWIGITLCPSVKRILEFAEPNRIAMHANDREFFSYLDDIEEESGMPGIADIMKLAQPTTLLRVEGERMLLNPLNQLHSTWFHSVYDEGVVSEPLHNDNAPQFPHDILALQFILNLANEPFGNDKVLNGILAKYKHTAEVFKRMIPADCIEWALKVYDSFPDCADEGYGNWKKL